ncbi:hypothetical protein MY10362_005616 [Beauveria mimosiformis]
MSQNALVGNKTLPPDNLIANVLILFCNIQLCLKTLAADISAPEYYPTFYSLQTLFQRPHRRPTAFDKRTVKMPGIPFGALENLKNKVQEIIKKKLNKNKAEKPAATETTAAPAAADATKTEATAPAAPTDAGASTAPGAAPAAEAPQVTEAPKDAAAEAPAVSAEPAAVPNAAPVVDKPAATPAPGAATA